MILLPTSPPAFSMLRNKFLKTWEFYAHYTQEFEAGVIAIQRKTENFAIYFENGDSIKAFYWDQQKRMYQLTEDQFFAQLGEEDAEVSLYKASSTDVYLWAEAVESTPVHSDLSTAFVDINNLMTEIQKEKLTGSLLASSGAGDQAVIFIQNGESIGGVYSWKAEAGLDTTDESFEELCAKLRESTGSLNVFRKGKAETSFQVTREQKAAPAPKAPQAQAAPKSAAVPKPAAAASAQLSPEEVSRLLTKLLSNVTKQMHAASGKNAELLIKEGFSRDSTEFSFLDPFRGVLKYANNRVQFTGKDRAENVFRGVVTSIRRTAQTHKIDLDNAIFTQWKNENRL